MNVSRFRNKFALFRYPASGNKTHVAVSLGFICQSPGPIDTMVRRLRAAVFLLSRFRAFPGGPSAVRVWSSAISGAGDGTISPQNHPVPSPVFSCGLAPPGASRPHRSRILRRRVGSFRASRRSRPRLKFGLANGGAGAMAKGRRKSNRGAASRQPVRLMPCLWYHCPVQPRRRATNGRAESRNP